MDSDLSTWTLLAAANRWGLYTLTLLASGSGLFLVATPLSQTCRDAASRLGVRAAVAAAFCFAISLGLGGADMMDSGIAALGDIATWRLAAETSLGTSATVGIIAMAVLWCGLHWRMAAVVSVGALGGLASFLFTGHAATASPLWIAAPAVALHLAGAAYWIGALYPLRRGLQSPLAESAVTLAAFSSRAVVAVLTIVVSGAAISWIQLGTLSAVVATAYGNRLLLKIGLFSLVVAIAAFNKLVLTPQVERGESAGVVQLRRVIVLEYLLIVLILGAAVSLTLVEPPRALAAAGTQ